MLKKEETLNFQTYQGTKQEQSLVLLHGWGQSLRELAPLAKILAKSTGITCVLFDLPGHGKSPIPSTALSPQEVAEVLEKNITNLEKNIGKNIYLLGHSYGGKVAIKMANLSCSFSINGLILCAASGVNIKVTPLRQLRSKFLKALALSYKSIDKIFKTKFFENNFSRKYASRDYLAATNPIIRNMLVKTVNEDIQEELSQIKLRTLILWGESDLETPLLQGKIMNKLLSNSKLISFKHKDHYFHEGVGHHLLAKYIIKFLDK